MMCESLFRLWHWLNILCLLFQKNKIFAHAKHFILQTSCNKQFVLTHKKKLAEQSYILNQKYFYFFKKNLSFKKNTFLIGLLLCIGLKAGIFVINGLKKGKNKRDNIEKIHCKFKSNQLFSFGKWSAENLKFVKLSPL